jgi:hypothetical protein
MRAEKMTISWERFVTRPANEQDVAESTEWHQKHPGGAGAPYVLGEEIDVEETVELPAKYDVCDRCQGKGSHVNPSIDGHGISMDEWWGPDWDDESREDYMNGAYDVGCYECNGKRVVLEVDENACDKALLEAYYKDMRRKSDDDYADRRMRWAEDGCRGSFNDY